MTGSSASLGIPHPSPPSDELGARPARPGKPLRLCTRCGGVGTHYLTCPSLRLPADHHAGEGSVRERLGGLVPGRAGSPG
jgi:hypothetical protein